MQTHKDETNTICKTCEARRKESLKVILDDFFTLNSVESFKEEMWNWFIAAMSSEDIGDWSGKKRSNLAILYKDLVELVERLDGIR
ncbi:hypothetical protein [Peijinzhouia sedimentorum]